MSTPDVLKDAIQKRLELLLAVALFLTGIYISLSLLDNPFYARPAGSVLIKDVAPHQQRALSELLHEDPDAPRASREWSFHILELQFVAGDYIRKAAEVQRAHAPLTAAWQIERSSGAGDSISRLVPLTVASSTRGTTVLLTQGEATQVEVLLAARNLGRLQPKIKLGSVEELQRSDNYYRYLNGVTLGVFIFLAAFATLIALIAKDRMFLFFGGWSLTSLRSVAVNEGWATNWLYETFPEGSIPTVVGATLALHMLFTMLLFGSIFRTQLTGSWQAATNRSLALASLCLVPLAIEARSPYFYPVVWTVASLGMMFIALSVINAWRRSRTSVLMWYSGFWLVTLAGLAGEIVYAAGLIAVPMPIFNAQGGATLGALVMAVTLAQYFVDERKEKRRAQLAEVDALKRLASTYGSMPIGLFRMEQSGEITVFNPAFKSLFKLPQASSKVSRLTAQRLFGPEAYKLLLEISRHEDARSCQASAADAEGVVKHLQFTAHSSEEGVEGSVQDITARVIAEAALARLIDHDTHTQALNQRGLNDAVKEAVRLASEGIPCALAELDVDRFKTLNDLYGHLVGDQLLSSVCDRLVLELNPGDKVARIGDSFRIVMLNCDPQAATSYARRLHQSISGKAVEVAGRVLAVSASVGLVPIDVGMDVRDVIAASSQACAEAKQKGRNRVFHMAKEDMALRGYLEELKVQENLQDKINSQRFFLEYQPIVSFRSAFETLNYEVLVRMRGENGATIPPGRFIPAAERNGQMSLIDRWVLLKTLHWLNDSGDHLKRLDYATINLSGASLNDARFVDNIFSMISDFPNVMSKLCFEITETVALADRRATRRFSERVHSLGSKIALDDFGAGYTSFTYLREIEADIIKIDGSFVRDINQNPANHAITRMIVELSHELGKSCVAEWAEQPDVIATLMQLGVDYGQGYALARPMAPEALLFAGSSGDLVTEPTVRSLLKGTLSAQQVAATSRRSTAPTALL